MLLVQFYHQNTPEKSGQKYYFETDPRVRIFTALFLICAVILTEQANWLQFGAVSILLALNIILSGLSVNIFVGRLFKIYPMIFLMSFMFLFNKPLSRLESDPMFMIMGLKIYHAGIIAFLDLNIRSLLIVSSSFFLIFSVPFEKIVQALKKLQMPDWIEAILIFMHRFIYITADEFSRIHMAYKSRAIRISLFRKIKIIIQITGVYLVRLIERSEQSHLSMVSKGFTGKIYSLESISWQQIDTANLTINFVIISLIVVLL
jgi:cobalt/nickel transport system permease protein